MLTWSSSISSWQTLDTTFYRHIHLYDLPWTVSNLDHHFVAIDKNGGSIGVSPPFLFADKSDHN